MPTNLQVQLASRPKPGMLPPDAFRTVEVRLYIGGNDGKLVLKVD